MEEKKKFQSSPAPLLACSPVCAVVTQSDFFAPSLQQSRVPFTSFALHTKAQLCQFFGSGAGGEVGLGGDTAEVARVPYTESCGTLTPFPAQWPKLLTASACRKKRFIMTVRVLYIKKFGSLKRLFASSDTYILTS